MSETKQRRRLAAILAADVVGYTQAMAADEAGTQAQVRALLDGTIAPTVTEHDGRVFKELGDGCLAEFPSAVGAAQAAAAIQTALAVSELPLQLRIGLHVGDVLVEENDLFGDGVIIATRIQSEAEPGGVVVSDAFRRHAEGRAGLAFDNLGARELKNVAEPMEVYALRSEGAPKARRRPSRVARLALAAATATVIGLTAYLGVKDYSGEGEVNRAQASTTPAVAVLPFENLSPDPEQAYFADGLAEDLITDLSKIGGVQVISRTSSFAVDRNLAAVEIASRLNANYIVTGSVRRAGEQLRITATLVDAQADNALWAQRFDGTRADVFGFQDRITAEIVMALKVQLSPAERQAIETRGTANPAAYDAYLRGLRAVAARRRLDPEANSAAQSAFEEAVRVDPDYALAYAGLAWTKWLYYETINSFGGDAIQAFKLAEQSLAIKDNALAHRTLANRHFALLNDFMPTSNRIDLAIAELEAARRLQPGDPDILADLAARLPFAGRPQDGVELVQRAMQQNPGHPEWYYAASGVSYLLSGNPRLAIRDLQRWSGSASTWGVPYLFLASAYGLAGQETEAKAALGRYAELNIGIANTTYAIKRKWPMQPAEAEIFLRGLGVAGLEDSG